MLYSCAQRANILEMSLLRVIYGGGGVNLV